MSTRPYVRWREGGWIGWRADGTQVDLAVLARADTAPVRRSRHAQTVRLEGPAGVRFVKTYAPPDGFRATRAFRMGGALEDAGFGVPVVVLLARRGRAGILVTEDTGGTGLAAAVERLAGDRTARRALLRALGREIARLHTAGFVHGDLVPSNVQQRADEFVLLDHDRTRRGRWLVWLTGRRNLVQLGRFVIPGVTLTDRVRVLTAYTAARGFSRRRRRRLARWLVRKTIARRCRIDRIPVGDAARVGFRELMRSGGRFDPMRADGRA